MANLPKFSNFLNKDKAKKDDAPQDDPKGSAPPDDSNAKPGTQEKSKQPSGTKEVDIGPVTTAKTMTGEVKDKIILDPKKGTENIEEAADVHQPTAVISWGRMNPPTTGHKKLVDHVKKLAKVHKADPLVYLTHSQDPKKNPLPYADKIEYAKKAFGDVIQHSDHRNLTDVMKNLQSKYQRLVVVVGGDRVQEFHKFLHQYNGKDYHFHNIDVVSAGDRDPDSEKLDGMSASKMRDAAKAEDLEKFKKGLPKELHPHHKDIYDKLRKHMKLHEAIKTDAEECLIDMQPDDLLGIAEQLYNYATQEPQPRRSPEAIIREEIYNINSLVV